MRYIKAKNQSSQSSEPQEIIENNLSPDIEQNLAELKVLLAGCSDAVIKEFKFGSNPEIRAVLVYFDGLADRQEVENNLLKSLMLEFKMLQQEPGDFKNQDIVAVVQDQLLTLAELKTVNSMQEICHHISSGDTVLLLDGFTPGLVAGTRSWKGRGVETPENEIVIFGPKEGFTETLRFNTALLRRRLKSTSFKVESLVLGRITKTDVVLCYIDSVAPRQLVDEVKRRLAGIDIDGVLDTAYLKEFIVDDPKTLFTQVEHTEKPDRVCGHLLEGRVCIMVDGSPMAMVVPISFPMYWISPEDYYTHYIPASLFRLLRFSAFWLALLLPSLYIAMITYHHEMVPTELLLTIAATRQGVPFPAFVEALLLEVTFELLREAGLRLPRSIGPAVSIVGALIIGDAAVQAGLVSTPMVVIVAFTGIASFISPAYNAAIMIRILRFGFLIASALMGFLGIMIGLIIMLVRMASLSSFGVPYLSPIAPFNREQLGDILVRRHWTANKQRPYLEGMDNTVRQGEKHHEK